MELVRFDWAIKRLLRNKADYGIVEGLLTVLLNKPIKIKCLLESEANKDFVDDKFNRVDLLAESETGELMIFEIQNTRELNYFHRMIYGTSKVISEYLKSGEPYDRIKKVYSINIVYFSLGQGDDYAYKGTTNFVSMHNDNDILVLSQRQKETFKCETPADIFPEYFLLMVDKFNDVAKTPLDEWISFLKNGEIPETATAPGLLEAREKLRVANLDDAERRAYEYAMENISYQRSVIETGRIEGRLEGIAEGEKIGIEKGRVEGKAEGIAEAESHAHQEKLENARKMKSDGLSIEAIAKYTNLPISEIEKL
mgnify:CR=1 FL=1